jgi:exosortase
MDEPEHVRGGSGSPGNRIPLLAFAAVGIICLWFAPVLREWLRIAAGSSLHSHVVLIPLVSAYLLVTDRKKLTWDSRPAPGWGILLFALAAALAAWTYFSPSAGSAVDRVALRMLCLLGGVWSVGLGFMGLRWMRSALFPAGFLLFMIPLPDRAVEGLEHFLMVTSVHLSELLLTIAGIPVIRTGQELELPGIVLEVAEECSGIRSSWVLFVTSVLAARLLLPTLPRRLILIALVLPLGILRNATRIHVIGWLCVTYGPETIDSWIHRKGGPVFFIASLVPLLLTAWWLKRGAPVVTGTGEEVAIPLKAG